MGDQVKILKGNLEVPVEPVGSLVGDGWLPGTWVKPASAAPVLTPGVLFAVERSDGTSPILGFVKTGSQHKQPVLTLSDMWTTDVRQTPGGDVHADWSGFDAGGPMEFDKQGQLQRLGSRVVTLQILDNGAYKFYVFETLPKAVRHGGPGVPLVYAVGDPIYVSENGLTTKEQEDGSHPDVGFIVARVGSDVEGDFILICSAV
jgi:hypothetical protein